MTRSILERSPRLILAGLLLGSSLACGESSPTGAPVQHPPSLALSSSAAAFAALLGAPGPAAQVVEVTNAGGGALDGLTATVAYGAGQPTGWLSATLSGTTAPATLTLTASTTATDAGLYDATVTVSGSVGSETVDVTLALAEGAAPTIEVTSPTRAAMLEQGTFTDSDVQITGQTCHDSVPITELAVNGVDVPVAGTNLCEAFDVTQSSAWGLSTITVHAANAYGRTADVVQSYLRSPSFQTAALPPDPIPAGGYLQLNQPALDDNSADLDDLASLLESVLSASAVYASLPNLLYSQDVLQTNDWWNPCTDELQVFKDGLSWTGRSVDLLATATDVDVVARLEAPRLGIRVSYTGCLGNTTTVYGALEGDRVILSGSVAASSSGPTVTAALTADLVTPYLDLNQGGFISEVTTQIVNIVFPYLAELLEGFTADVVGPVFAGSVHDFVESSSQDQPVSVNGGELTVHAAPDRIHHLQGALRVGVATRVAPAAAPGAPTPALGAILAGGSGTPPAFSMIGYAVGIGVRLDAINQLLWSAWRAGAFEVPDLTAVVGVGAGLGGSVSALLPPVVRPGTGAHALEIGWGDLAVSAIVDRATFGLPGGTTGAAATIEGFGSARLGLTLAYDDVEHRVGVTAISADVQVQIVDSEDLLDEDAIAAAVADAIESLFAELIPSAVAAVPVPALELATSSLGLAGVTVGRDGDYLTLTGDVVVR
jgi:hypothetical protein